MQFTSDEYIIGNLYIIEYNNGLGKWKATYVGNNIYGQATFKIKTNCIEKDNQECPFVRNPKVSNEIIKDEPLYKDCCICQFICKQDVRLNIYEYNGE
jgi:hypothetical protein